MVRSGALIAALVFAAWTAAGCGADSDETVATSSSLSSTPRTHAHVKEVFAFSSLAEMLATADVVVVGQVTEIAKGDVLGGGDETGAAADELQLYDVSLQIERTISGSPGNYLQASDEIVVLDEDNYLVSPWSVGDRVLLFLEEESDGGLQVLSSQGRFLEEDGRVVSSNDDFGWAAELERGDWESLLGATEEAREDVQSGAVAPAPDPRVEK